MYKAKMKDINKTFSVNDFYEVEHIWWFKNNDLPPSTYYNTSLKTNEVLWDRFKKELLQMPYLNVSKSMHVEGEYIQSNTITTYIANTGAIISFKENTPENGVLFISRINVLYDNDIKSKSYLDIDSFIETLSSISVTRDYDKSTGVYMLTTEDMNIKLNEFDINTPEMDISLNYGDEFRLKSDKYIEHLKNEDLKGISLFYGEPGTGKSMYLRYLANSLGKYRKIIYLPNTFISVLSNPDFMPILKENKNSILVLEDADNFITSRDLTGNYDIDKILNLSDGILNDVLKIHVICTFNTNISNVDIALLRKGRLIFKHEFKKLNIQDAQKLSNKLGYKTTITKELPLCDIYNQNSLIDNEVKKDRKIGFY